MIRKAEPQDIDAIIRVLSSFDFTLLPEKNRSVIDPRFPDHFRLSNRVVEFAWERSFVAERDGEIVGFCHYTITGETTAATRLLTVLPECREYGYGTQLQLARMEAAYKSGITELHTSSAHPKSIEWYKKHFGYVEHGTEDNSHGLIFFRLPDRVVWGLHYGLKEHPVCRKLTCNLTGFFEN